LVFTVEHNANPFHQGLLAVAYQYGDNQFLRGNKPSMVTHLPHTPLDIAHNTQAVLRVPYLSEFEYIGGSTSEVSHVNGRFFLTQVLGTPTLTNSATPVYKVYLHLENIEVFGRLPIAGTTFVVPQSGAAVAPRGRTAADVELSENGRISGVLASAAKVPTAVGRAFPSIKAFMGSASWFLNASAKAAAAFGFSRPVDTAPLHQIYRAFNGREHNVDSIVPASVVGGFSTNQVAVSDALGGTDLDEMAFDTILTRYSQIYRGSIATTDVHGTNEYLSHVCLNHMWFRAPSVVDGGNVSFPRGSTTQCAVYPSTLLYVSQHFKYWHGGLKYRVTFAKSKFHTGRVMFSFVPNYRQIFNVNQYSDLAAAGGPVPGTFNGDLQPSQYSMVYDLKDGSQFEFEVPYIAPVPHVGVNDSLGFVSMQIMDPLVANGESASTISFIVEVAAMPGFYFAGLAAPGQPAWVDITEPAVEFQSGVGGSMKDASQFSVGEKFMSLKQLAMHPIVRRHDQANATIALGVIPMWPCSAAWGTGTALAAGTVRTMPFMRSGMIAQCYAYGIGSTLLSTNTTSLGAQSFVKIQMSKNDNNATVVGTVPGIYNQANSTPNAAWSYSSRGALGENFLLPTLAGAPRFRMGDFNFSSPTRDWAPDVANVETTSQSVKAVYNFCVRNNDGGTRNWYWGVSAADDARAAAWIGPCPMILANSTTATNTWYSGNPL